MMDQSLAKDDARQAKLTNSLPLTYDERSFNALLFSCLCLGKKENYKHSLFLDKVRIQEINEKIETLEFDENGDIELYGYKVSGK